MKSPHRNFHFPPAIEPLADPVFRGLWIAWAIANLCMWMNDVAAAWLMTSLTESVMMVALVQTASTLPVFLLGIPSGALADIVDRRRYFAATQLWIAAVALVLCGLSITHNLSAPWLLGLVFANGIGLAMRWPVFAGIVPELVDRERLPAALALNGLAMNVSRIIGPALAGALLASAGSAAIFLLNSVLAALSFALIFRWRPKSKKSSLPSEKLFSAMRVGLRHVLESPPLRSIWIKVFLFFLQSATLTALLPIIARDSYGDSANAFSFLLASMGFGSISMMLLMPSLRSRLSGSQILQVGSMTHAICSCVVVEASSLWLSVPFMFVSGMAWIGTANTLTVAAQQYLPNWVRSRGMSIYLMGLMGGSAVSAIVWGNLASFTSVSTAVFSASAFGLITLLLTRHMHFEGSELQDQTPQFIEAGFAEPSQAIAPHAGPVVVTVEYLIDPAAHHEFLQVMKATRSARLRQGVMSWSLVEDLAHAGRFIERFDYENWTEHQRRLERQTPSDLALRAQRLRLHIGEGAPKPHRFIEVA